MRGPYALDFNGSSESGVIPKDLAETQDRLQVAGKGRGDRDDVCQVHFIVLLLTFLDHVRLRIYMSFLA